ncbi:TPA: hypothetical protein N3463_002722 [Klebsiella aerogenes]|uniref:HEPN domain-containing protein n=1 Tax=Enterobacteriaceae TaxID=543 RepID=UPI001F49D847|nr:HEPN domain-containing protein [Escherichia coli]MCH6879409.1 hypothetical protein [Escherichia coli]HCM6056478.1 hypothetical protein [Klebsiella aerogenes]HCM7903249.1 hypothetical protein [Klebsiella aerogenes]HCM7908374.1 hypothetical protein [Klebsiella aerogenes]
MKDNEIFYGEFSIHADCDSVGKLTLAKENTNIELTVKSKNIIQEIPNIITGKLDQLKKATCVDCIITSSGTSNNSLGDSANYLTIFPHHVLIGDDHLDPNASHIKSFSFHTQDTRSLFQDNQDFGKIYPQEKIVDFINKEYHDKIKLHEYPNVFFHSGRLDIINCETSTGCFRVYNKTTIHGLGTNGKFLTNTVRIEYIFQSPTTFSNCVSSLLSHLRLLTILAGREQSVVDFQVHVASNTSPIDKTYSVHSSYLNCHNENANSYSLNNFPIEPSRDVSTFIEIYKAWMSKESELLTSRIRYNNGIIKHNSYDVDRLVSAANIFDILPDNYKPTKKMISEDLNAAKSECKRIFKSLPESVEKSIMLGALGRLGSPTLTDIILHRANIILERCGWLFPELDLVVKTAVKVRNYFVHGTASYPPYKIESTIPFLTDVLEFIFISSDLIECGWNIDAWANNYYSLNHPFNNLRHKYKNELQNLKLAIQK